MYLSYDVDFFYLMIKYNDFINKILLVMYKKICFVFCKDKNIFIVVKVS